MTRSHLLLKNKGMSTSVRNVRTTVFLEMSDLTADISDRAGRAFLQQRQRTNGDVVKDVFGEVEFHSVRHTANSRILADISIGVLVQNAAVEAGSQLTGTVVGTYDGGVTIRAGKNIYAIVQFPNNGSYMFRDGVWFVRHQLYSIPGSKGPVQPSPPPHSPRGTGTGTGTERKGSGGGQRGNSFTWERVAAVGTDYTCRIIDVITTPDGVRKCFAEVL